MRIPFAYVIESTDGHIYVGSRYCINAHPSQLLTTYFTSSNYAKPIILENISKWKITRLYETHSTEDALRKEMEWQLELRYNKGLLNKSINRANGKWVNYGPKSEETKRKISASRMGLRNTPEVAAKIGLKNLGKRKSQKEIIDASNRKTTYWNNLSHNQRQDVGNNISVGMKLHGTSKGSKNANTTKWVLLSPAGETFTQPENQSGKEFIQSLGLSYQMLMKYRKQQLPFGGKLKGWQVVFCSRPEGHNYSKSGLRSKLG
ncbi:hypothetical protein [Acinetobacter sp.]|uniref:hypothetical protein n=1 Tax=Acinetobacter sp. TaxID=472 RepID=UPI00388FB164